MNISQQTLTMQALPMRGKMSDNLTTRFLEKFRG